MNIYNYEVPSGAQYTEFLRDYLKTNELPASLSDADTAFELDFKETFKNYFLMREIGFHSEEMFAQKLNVQIDIWLPYYIEKANHLKTLFNNIFENGFTITQTNNLSHSDTETINRDATNTQGVTRNEDATTDDTTTNTNNLTQSIERDATTIEKDYNTPAGEATDDLPASALSSGKKSTFEESDTQRNTGTIESVKHATNNVDITEDKTDTIDESISTSKGGTNTGTITTLYSKNPRYNSVEALKEFQENFKNIVHECLKSFDCLFMQIF